MQSGCQADVAKAKYLSVDAVDVQTNVASISKREGMTWMEREKPGMWTDREWGRTEQQTDRLEEARQLLQDATALDDKGFPQPGHYDAKRFDALKAFQLFYWLIAEVERLQTALVLKTMDQRKLHAVGATEAYERAAKVAEQYLSRPDDDGLIHRSHVAAAIRRLGEG